MMLEVFRKSWNIFFAALVSFLLVSCGGRNSKNDESVHSVSGKISYVRLPVKVDNTGYPLGLETPDKAETLPLRGIAVRAVYLTKETMPDGTKTDVWQATPFVTTNSSGVYSIDLPDDDTLPTFVEVLSLFKYSSSGGSPDIRIIADPDGINSLVPQADRVLYAIRKGLDGSAPEGEPTPIVSVKGKIALDFEIGLDSRWWITHPLPRNAPNATLESFGSGSKIAAIIDTAYKAADSFGDPSFGGLLDLHYRRGITEPLGTYVEYDRERFPLAFEPSGATGGGVLKYFGSVRGGLVNDDSRDEGVLLSMMARNFLRSSGISQRFQFPSKYFPDFDTANLSLMTNLQPTMALADGLPDAIAAITLKTPYLTSGSGTIVRDIRQVSGLPSNIYSAPAIAAFTWELALKANSINTPGSPEAWEKIEQYSINRFYSLGYITAKDEDTGITTVTDLPSLFTQLTTLPNEKGAVEPVDLAKIFTDELITQITTPFFGNIWPRPKSGELSCFITNWGKDPDSIKTINFSMFDAVPDAEDKFSNLTVRENFCTKISITKDTAYWLSVVANPPLPDNTSIKVRIVVDPLYNTHPLYETNYPVYSHILNFTSSNPQRIILTGNPDKPISYTLDFSINSPKIKLPDTQISVRFDPAY